MSKTLKNANPEWVTSKQERMNYYLYFCGQNVIYALVSTYLVTFLLFQGVDPAKSAAVMLAVKIWDAVNDAIFGCIFDKVHFKNGQKFIPWLRISLLAIPITTVLLFFIPKNNGSNEMLQLAWFAIAYVLWDTAYTLCDVPIFGYVTAMSNRLDERTSLMSYKSIWAGVGTALATVIGTIFVNQQLGLSYKVVAIVCSVIALATMAPICFKGKERYGGESDESFTVRSMFKYLFSNKYLLIYYIGFFFFSALNVSASLNLFVSYYLFHNENFSLFVGALSVVPMLIFSVLVPKFIKRFDKMKIYLACTAASALLGLITWLVGYNNIIIFAILTVLKNIPGGISGVMLFMFTPDCAEYGKFKTGIDAKGITFAIQTFMVKLTAAVSSALPLTLLSFFKWSTVKAESFQELQANPVIQSEYTLNGLWFIYTMLPVIGLVIAGAIWYFYRLKDKDVQLMTDCNIGKISKEEALAGLSIKNEFTEN